MVKFRRAIQQVTAGQAVNPIQLREGDYWQDFADDFNRMLASLRAVHRDRNSANGATTDVLTATAGDARI